MLNDDEPQLNTIQGKSTTTQYTKHHAKMSNPLTRSAYFGTVKDNSCKRTTRTRDRIAIQNNTTVNIANATPKTRYPAKRWMSVNTSDMGNMQSRPKNQSTELVFKYDPIDGNGFIADGSYSQPHSGHSIVSPVVRPLRS